MSQSTKRILSTIAIIIASVAFGVVITADLGLMRKSAAQTSTPITTSQGPVTSVTIPSFADVASRVMPAVVSITSTELVKQSDSRRFGGIDPFDFFFPDPRQNPHRAPRGQQNDDDDERPQRSGGSGFIISPDGYILTNNPVVEGATKVEVHFGADENGNGGRTIPAKIIGRDTATDIALVKIDVGQNLPYVPLGDSDRIRKGDWAIAIGNPFQLENTLTVGVISAKGRALGFSEETRSFENFIQTDAAINFGNSGGPLMNINGEVVGINTAIRGGGAQGLGFATPINTAKRLLPQLKQGKVTRGYLGMTITEVTEDARETFNLPPSTTGALVQNVTPGKPADKAGIQHGDVVVEIDGRPIKSNRDLIDYISYLPVGSDVKIAALRNGQRQTFNARTAERPTEQTASEETTGGPAEPARNKLGIAVQDVTPALRQNYGLPDDARGVIVTDVKAVSAAADAGIAEGDVISEVQGQRVNNSSDFRSAIERFRSGQKVRMYVTSASRSGGFSSYRYVTIP
ncbi:MAG TPA: trypsin-like peptidase domain-containing protein [Thermoanaerobaculia bacterium]|nr:trypsin-like peptidase domain-containing protein [Thermoanaerobaculia bacterium]